jgi:hypothetical protein
LISNLSVYTSLLLPLQKRLLPLPEKFLLKQRAPRLPRRLRARARLPLPQPMGKRRNVARHVRRLTVRISIKVGTCWFWPRAFACWLMLIRCVAQVLKQVHPDTGISNKAMAILNSFVNDIFERIATEASSTVILPHLSVLLTYFVPCRARSILEEIYDLFSRNSDQRASHPPRRTRQTCHLRGHKIGYQ